MELSPEERRQIYEEEKARIEAEQTPHKVKRLAGVEADDSTRTQRITASSVAIAFSIALLILFYIFRQYLAYYQIEQHNGAAEWVRYEVLTGAFFNVWLPILTATLILSIIGHVVAIVFDKYIVRQSIIAGLNLLGIGTVAYLLAIFPFNFSSVPVAAELVLSALLKILLVVILVILSVITIVNLIKLIVRVATKTASY